LHYFKFRCWLLLFCICHMQELSALPPLPGCAPGHVEFAQLDLCSLKNVRAFAKSFNAQRRRLDVLVCNAGIMSPANKLVTQDGLEMQFQVRGGWGREGRKWVWR
jgi:NAD(P)-dependent dehydrogenase (short-subunit alcohol dehydrogenase family)